jgi:hypothetical protein
MADRHTNLTLYVEGRLKEHTLNPRFNNYLSRLKTFYAQKFLYQVQDEKREAFYQYFTDMFNAQFFNGYFIASEILKGDNNPIPDEWYQQPEGILTLEVTRLVQEAIGTAELIEAVRTNEGQKFSLWIITQIEDILHIVRKVITDITILGAKQAFLDQRNERKIKPPKTLFKGFFSRLDDVYFVESDKYLTCEIKTDTTELWSLNEWMTNSFNQETKIGEVMIVKVGAGVEETYYYVRLNLKDTIIDLEKVTISKGLQSLVAKRQNISPEKIDVQIGVIKEFYRLVDNP